jgi:hypothetical protein
VQLNLKLVRRLLERHGFEARAATTLRDALTRMCALTHSRTRARCHRVLLLLR